MTVRCFLVGTASVAIWSDIPTLKDVDDVTRSVQGHKASLGPDRKVVLVGILSEGCKMPSDLVRTRMGSLWPILIGVSSTVQFVNLTRGFVSARVISLLVSVFALGQRGQVQIHQSLLPALNEAAKVDPSLNVTELHKQIDAALALAKE